MWVPFEVPTRSQRITYESARPDAGVVEAFWFAEDIRVHREHVRVMEERRAARKALADSLRELEFEDV
jgi:hypothetical protein